AGYSVRPRRLGMSVATQTLRFAQARSARTKVAYIMSRFPKVTETFVLGEMVAVERMGVQVQVYPLLRAHASRVHSEGASLWRKIAAFCRPARGEPVMHAEAPR